MKQKVKVVSDIEMQILNSYRTQYKDIMRRTLFMMQMLKYEMESLEKLPICPKALRMDITNLHAGIRRFMADARDHAKFPEQWSVVAKELSSENLLECSLILDIISQVNHVEAIREAIELIVTGEINNITVHEPEATQDNL